MTDWQIQQRAAAGIKKDFPVGSRVLITFIADSKYKQECVGGRGTVENVDDMGQVDVRMDSGQSICLCRHYGDLFHRIKKEC